MKPVHILQTIAEWEEFKQNIPQPGLIIFKFSPRCPISRSVEHKFDTWYKQLAEETAPLCAKVDVINSRELSQYIAQTLNVEHESPQAIWLTSQQQVYWHDSHYSITSKALNKQLCLLINK